MTRKTGSRPAPGLAAQVGARARRKLRARRDPAPGVWLGLGTMGLIGWSVALPTLAGAALGRWIDLCWGGAHRWTLALLVAGLTLGCFNAWHWVAKEERAIHEGDERHDD